jgi:hypothetical protein
MSMFRQPRALAMALVVAVTASVTTGCGLLARNDLAKLPAPIPPVRGELRTQFSLRYIDIVQGTGAPAEPGKLYVVHYTGWLRDGTSFDSSRGREPLRFEQGAAPRDRRLGRGLRGDASGRAAPAVDPLPVGVRHPRPPAAHPALRRADLRRRAPRASSRRRPRRPPLRSGAGDPACGRRHQLSRLLSCR